MSFRRYVGYRSADQQKPWAPYFTATVREVQPQVLAAYDGLVGAVRGGQAVGGLVGAVRGGQAVGGLVGAGRGGLVLGGMVDELNGVEGEVETGYGRLGDGTVWVACQTDMPGVTAQMWDWWFGWHVREASRYKLWHPAAHAFAGLTVRGPVVKAGPRSAYIGLTSFVDELVGPWMLQLAISFRDPVAAGFHLPDGTTVVYGRVGSAVLPFDAGYLAHQVRPIAGGSRMRSRFYLNHLSFRRPNLRQAAWAVARGPFSSLRAPLPPDEAFARELLLHCGQEMNHLASFLPDLYAEFKDTD